MDTVSLLSVSLGCVFTAALLLKLGYIGGMQAAELGSVSDQWVAAYRASEPASSI